MRHPAKRQPDDAERDHRVVAKQRFLELASPELPRDTADRGSRGLAALRDDDHDDVAGRGRPVRDDAVFAQPLGQVAMESRGVPRGLISSMADENPPH